MYKILVAEDESEMRNLLVKYIKNTQPDFKVIGSAVNGKEALELTEQCRPDVVITDISMPVMDGIEFLQEVNARNIPIKVIIISGYDEFAYAKKAIVLGASDYLLKPFDPMELDEVLNKIKNEFDKQKILIDNMQFLKEKAGANEILLKDQILNDILSGKMTEIPDERILDVTLDYYGVCLLKIPMYFISGKWGLGDQKNIEEWVKILSDGCMPKGIRVQGVRLAENGQILILSGNASEKQKFFSRVKEGMEHLLRSMEKYYNLRLISIVGGIYEDWTGISSSYEETLRIWRGLTVIDKSIIICEEEKRLSSSEMKDFSKKIHQLKGQILLCVRMSMEEKSQEYLDELMQVYASIPLQKNEFIGISVEELIYAIFNELELNGIRLEEKMGNKEIRIQMREQLKDASLMEIKKVLQKCLELCQKSFASRNCMQQSELLIRNIKDLVEANLDYDGLTLDWIAEQVHYSEAYVRQIFKQKTEERLMEYVIRKRMEKAGDLLLNSKLKIQEISEACGYSNQRYFASSFKKYYGCTPTDFKTMMERR